ncbi:upstream-binding factor 1-like protein 1 isoform X1 [Hippocampus comes]|uniref:upstream-binding factor 1-like protein 1 isoform X1 n=1 Tax=Hippocampus comes TaxID=109280 RepID=UPI00094E6467|nr:PREDICTED: upstream-binding factor 1-like protein 1 isoform X1 [Hippocampus comes]
MDTAWTTENLLKLLNAMKTNISDGDRMRAFLHGVKKLDWEKVAFPPFSPKDCQQKWRVVSHKMRKIRTLTELVDEAADELSNRTKKRPKKPGPPRIIFYEENVCKYHAQHPELTREKLFKLIIDNYNALTEEEKAPYVEKYQRAHAQYKKKFSDTDMQEKEKWLFKDTSEGESEKSLEESPEDTRPPKPPKSGYNLFCKEQRGSMEGVPKRGYVREWAQRWRDLTAGERNSFSLRCATMKTDYALKMKEYRLNRQHSASDHIGPTKKATRPSDSEDEDIDVSSSDEEEPYWDCDEEVDADHPGDICFDVF